MTSVTLSSKFQLSIPKGADTSDYRNRTDRLERYK